MASPEQFGIDPADFEEIQKSVEKLITPQPDPAVERNFGDDTDAEFRQHTEVVLPESQRVQTGESAMDAHKRLQQRMRKQSEADD